MADAALFEFLHTEMVAELWAHHSDPGPGGYRWSGRLTGGATRSKGLCYQSRKNPGRRCLWFLHLSSFEDKESLGAKELIPLHTRTEDEPVCAGGHGLPCGPGPGREAAPGDAGLQRGAGHPQVPLQRLVGCRVPEADGQPPHQSPGDLRPAGQQFPPPHPDGCRSAVSGGSPQGKFQVVIQKT
nr:trafficking protein particle complex subunit 6A isoform X2 [Vulpes vulpes]